MCSIHPTEYYSAFKRKEILTQATTWTNPEGLMRSEPSLTQKHRHGLAPHTGLLEQASSERAEGRLPGAGQQEEQGATVQQGQGFSFARRKKPWKWTVVMVV